MPTASARPAAAARRAGALVRWRCSLGVTGAAMGQARHSVYVEIDEVINPTIAGYLERAVEQAEERTAPS